MGRLKRNLPWLIATPALVVAVLVSFGVRNTIVTGYGRMVLAGASGIVAEAVPADESVVEMLASKERIDEVVSTRVRQGSLRAIAVVDPAGAVVYESAPGTADLFANVSIEGGSPGAVTAWLERQGDGDVLLVAGPALLGDGELTVLAIRPAEPVVASTRGAVVAVLATILSGAGITYGLIRWVVGRAVVELERNRRDLRAVERRLEDSLADLESHSVGTLLALTQAVDAKDSYTARHSLNVADYARVLAGALGFDALAPTVERAGLLHDIGKIGVPEELLLKPSSLDSEEFRIVRGHSSHGASIVESIPFLSGIVPAVMYHHERWDGQGYPDGLREDGIPLEARILAVVDAFDAMTTDRPYRKAMPVDRALDELVSGAGSQFDPVMVERFVESVRAGAIPRIAGAA